MNWIKLLLAAALIGICTFFGYLAAEKYRSRKEFYRQFLLFHERFLHELSYSKRNVKELLRDNPFTGQFAKAIDFYLKHRSLPSDLSFLSEDENSYLLSYFTAIGRSDAQSQIGYFRSQSALLSDSRNEAEKQAKTRGELYLKLGLLSGLAFVILIL